MAKVRRPRDSKGRFAKQTRRNVDFRTAPSGKVYPLRISAGYNEAVGDRPRFSALSRAKGNTIRKGSKVFVQTKLGPILGVAVGKERGRILVRGPHSRDAMVLSFEPSKVRLAKAGAT